MTHRTVARSALALVATLLLSATAQAQIFRAYLASDGSDANPCTLPSPCRLLPAAIAAVASGGQIWLLDSANYNTGTVNINKSVKILAVPGVVGSVVTNGGDAINIATAGVEVALRNLVIGSVVGVAGGNGIVMTAGDALTLESCLFDGLQGVAISVNAAAIVRMTDTIVRNNGSYGLVVQGGARVNIARSTFARNQNYGIFVQGAGANTTRADIAYSIIDNNGNGGVTALSSHASGVVAVSLAESQVTGNAAWGAIAQSNLGASVTLLASNNMIANNAGVGLGSFSTGARVLASGNTIGGNSYGLYNNGGLFESSGNNSVRNNATANTNGTITVVAME